MWLKFSVQVGQEWDVAVRVEVHCDWLWYLSQGADEHTLGMFGASQRYGLGVYVCPSPLALWHCTLLCFLATLSSFVPPHPSAIMFLPWSQRMNGNL